MELREALETAARILKTGERVELQPTVAPLTGSVD